MFFVRVLASIVFAFCFFQSHAQTAVEVIQKMQDVTRGDKIYSEVTMKIIRPRFTREMSMQSWGLGEDYSLIRVTAPARDRGIAYLKRKNEIWNWMPSVDRLIKLPPSMMTQSWMGSDFTNDDLVRETSVIDDYEHRLLKDEVIDGYLCYVIELKPKAGKPIVWSRVVVWVAKQHHFQLKAEQFDDKDKLVNRIEFSDVKNFGGRQLPAVMTLTPMNKPGHQTILIQEKIDFNPAITEDFFSIQNLQRLR
jgi:outer membrane lipoprotein-sorting protein